MIELLFSLLAAPFYALAALLKLIAEVYAEAWEDAPC